jgi:hypothetical protein
MSKIGEIFAKLDNYIHPGPWLQFVGYILAFGGLIAHSHWFGVPLAYLGLGISFAGSLYDRIYP